MENKYQPIIKLKSYRIDDLQYSINEDKVNSIPPAFHINPSIGINETKDVGQVTLDVSLKVESDESPTRVVTTKVTALFELSSSLTSIDEISHALIVNGTAIVFPYVRSLISMITGLDSSQTILLPTINTQELFDLRDTSSAK